MLRIHEFDPPTAGAGAWDAYVALRQQRSAEDAPGMPLPTDETVRRNLATDDGQHGMRYFIAQWDGQPVGNMSVAWRRAGTPAYESFAQLLHVGGGVLAPYRWRSVGSGCVQQMFTGVARPHRGRGLAKAAKARMLALIQEHLPQAQMVVTQNAASNAPMVRVNAAVGFEPFRHSLVYQSSREDLARALPA